MLDWVLLKAKRDCNGILVSDHLEISDLVYADDPSTYIGDSEVDLQRFVDNLDSYNKMIGLNICRKKTKMAISPSIFALMEKLSNRWRNLSTWVQQLLSTKLREPWVGLLKRPQLLLASGIFFLKERTYLLRQRFEFSTVLSSQCMAQSLELCLLNISAN